MLANTAALLDVHEVDGMVTQRLLTTSLTGPTAREQRIRMLA